MAVPLNSGECWKSGHFSRFTTLRNFILRGRRNTLTERFAEDALHFRNPWQAQQHFGDVHVHFSWPAQRFRRVELRLLQIAFLTLRQMVRSEKKVQILCDSSETFRKMMEALQEMSILR